MWLMWEMGHTMKSAAEVCDTLGEHRPEPLRSVKGPGPYGGGDSGRHQEGGP